MRIVEIRNDISRRVVLVVFTALLPVILPTLGVLEAFFRGLHDAYDLTIRNFVPIWRGSTDIKLATIREDGNAS